MATLQIRKLKFGEVTGLARGHTASAQGAVFPDRLPEALGCVGLVTEVPEELKKAVCSSSRAEARSEGLVRADCLGQYPLCSDKPRLPGASGAPQKSSAQSSRPKHVSLRNIRTGFAT